MIGDWESAMAPRLTEPERTRLNPPKAPPRQKPPPSTSPSCARAGWLSTNHGHRRIDWCFAHGLSGCQSGVEPMRSGDIRPCPFSGKLLPRPLAEKNGHYPESHSWLLPVLNTGHARGDPPPVYGLGDYHPLKARVLASRGNSGPSNPRRFAASHYAETYGSPPKRGNGQPRPSMWILLIHFCAPPRAPPLCMRMPLQ